MERKYIVYTSVILPALFELSLITTRVPSDYYSSREMTHAFQTLALVESGFRSYTFVTPLESYTGVHLYSLLASPLFALGYTESGRLVSLIAAVAAAGLIAVVGRELFGDRIAILAPAFLWIQPFFARHAYTFHPETLSIMLTLGVVALIVYFTKNGNVIYFLLGMVAMILAVFNHIWEATILLPVFIILAYNRFWLHTAIASVVTVGSVAFTWSISKLQPSGGASVLIDYGTFPNNWNLLLSPDWWGLPPSKIHPFELYLQLLLPITVLALIGCIAWSIRTRQLAAYVCVGWLISGLSIPLLLAKGRLAHDYYFWALVVPLALVAAICTERLLEVIYNYQDPHDISGALYSVALILVIGAIIYISVFEIGIFAATGVPFLEEIDGVSNADLPPEEIASGEAVEAGKELRKMKPIQSSDIAFVGKWEQNTSYRPYWGKAGRVLLYGRVVIKEMDASLPGGPKFYAGNTTPTNCKVMIKSVQERIVVQPCGSTV